MKVGLLGHATLHVATERVSCLVDPVLIDPFESNTNSFFPPVEIDVKKLTQQCDVVVISHGHMDHFCVRSLALLPRTVPVLFPKGDRLIEQTLKILGFVSRRALAPGDGIHISDLEIFATPSTAGFPEMGLLFRAENKTFWNMVDTVVNDTIISNVRAYCPDIDLLFAKHQPLIEEQLVINALGGDFPMERYGRLLTCVATVRPRAVVAGACGYRFASQEWLNMRGFPVSRARFLRDVATINPHVRGIPLTHGGTIDLARDFEVNNEGLDFVRRVDGGIAEHEWRPDRGVPPLEDRNAYGYRISLIKACVSRFVSELPAKLACLDVVWRERMRLAGAKWLLEVVFPDGALVRIGFDLADPHFAPSSFSAIDPDLVTSICASTIACLMRGECNSYSVYFNCMRVVNRLYSVGPTGVCFAGGLADEPISRLLLADADKKYVLKQARGLRSAVLS